MNHLSDDRIRLQKYMSECGVASRRKSEELIAKGAVKVNGVVAKIGDSVDPKRDIITLNGKKIENKTVAKYIMLHKPRGFVTTMSDELGRRCVASLVEDVDERVYPIGRLDRNSEGLLLLTNDGEFANAVMHPSKHVAKVYRVTIRPDISAEREYAFADILPVFLCSVSVSFVIYIKRLEFKHFIFFSPFCSTLRRQPKVYAKPPVGSARATCPGEACRA